MAWLTEINQPSEEALFACDCCGVVFFVPEDGVVAVGFEGYPRSDFNGHSTNGPFADGYAFLCDGCWADYQHAVEFEMRERVIGR